MMGKLCCVFLIPALSSKQNTGGISHDEWSNGSCYLEVNAGKDKPLLP